MNDRNEELPAKREYDWTHQWGAPDNAKDFFQPGYNSQFWIKHPIIGVLLVIAIFVLLLGPELLAGFIGYYTIPALSESGGTHNIGLMLIGALLCFVSPIGIGLGLCNLLMVLMRQYMGHKLTFYSIGIGLAATLIGYYLLSLS